MERGQRWDWLMLTPHYQMLLMIDLYFLLPIFGRGAEV
jgi:hypothetical protein